MLKTLDILIGLSVVMLFLSMIVTVITQFLINLGNMRGRHLLTGLADLLEQISPGIDRKIAQEISTAVLQNPLIRNANGGLGNVVHREELTKLLLELAASGGPQAASNGTPPLSQAAKECLLNTLQEDGLGDPAQIKTTLQNVRSLALQLELAHPELTNAARARIAMLQQVNSQFLGKINLWFDQTMDRVSERFTANTRWVTFATGLALALVLQLDTAALVSRLSTDQTMRDALVARAQNETAMPKPKENDKMQLSDGDRQVIRDVMMNNVLGVPQSWDDWTGRWNLQNWPIKTVGILLTAVLLSLGAPFWYNALQNLVRLRSIVASKDDQQRDERQLSQPAAAAVEATAEAGILSTDERGNLAIVA
jgi:hypothetical protein